MVGSSGRSRVGQGGALQCGIRNAEFGISGGNTKCCDLNCVAKQHHHIVHLALARFHSRREFHHKVISFTAGEFHCERK